MFRLSEAQRRGRTEEWEPRSKRAVRALERRRAREQRQIIRALKK